MCVCVCVGGGLGCCRRIWPWFAAGPVQCLVCQHLFTFSLFGFPFFHFLGFYWGSVGFGASMWLLKVSRAAKKTRSQKLIVQQLPLANLSMYLLNVSRALCLCVCVCICCCCRLCIYLFFINVFLVFNKFVLLFSHHQQNWITHRCSHIKYICIYKYIYPSIYIYKYIYRYLFVCLLVDNKLYKYAINKLAARWCVYSLYSFGKCKSLKWSKPMLNYK